MHDTTMTFDDVFTRVLGHEGKYVNNPADPGGETNWGISKRSYPMLDIQNLTREQAKFIYRRDFWDLLHLDQYASEETQDGIAFQLFDFAVNSGIGTAIRYLQRAVGVADDGYWGPVSRAALDVMSESDVIMLLTAERQEFMTKLANWPNASRGWIRRTSQNLRYGARDS